MGDKIKVALLTGGKDPHYALGMVSALISQGMYVDFIGNDDMEHADVVRNGYVHYHNLRGDQNPNVSLYKKTSRVLKYYYNLMKFAAKTDSQLFHILWLNKFTYFDSTLLNIYYKILGKKIVYTAHNINIRERDGENNFLYMLSLKFLYKIVDHIFVHTEKMKQQLVDRFALSRCKVSVIPFGINNVMPKTELTREQARAKLIINNEEKIILFFGNIAPYKGLELLVQAFGEIKEKHASARLVIAGQIKNCEKYWENIQQMIEDLDLKKSVLEKVEYISDDEVEIFFKAADVLVLPYKHIFQSGVLFLSYHFGLPVIAADVGSMKEHIIENKNGFICLPNDSHNLAVTIDLYFHSDVYKHLEDNRATISRQASEEHSWEKIGEITHYVYNRLL